MTPKELAHIHAACFTDRPWDTESIQKILSRPATRLFTKGRAFLLASIIAPEAEILTLAVDPAARRRGHARSLIDELKSQVDSIFLEVGSDNSPAIALYQACGFVETGRRAGYYLRIAQPPVDAVLMSWSKAPA